MYRIFELNPQLAPYKADIDLRMDLYKRTKSRLLGDSGMTLNDFANAHNYFGFHRVEGGWVYREWAPSAYQVYLTGEFNNWNWTTHPLKNLGNGSWELFLSGAFFNAIPGILLQLLLVPLLVLALRKAKVME